MGRSRIANQPIRLAAGAFLLNSGIEKLSANEERAARLHAMATGAFGFLKQLAPSPFVRALAATEIAIGAALVLPVVPDRLAGLALTPFAGGLVYLYTQTDAFHQPGSLRPSAQGTAVAKDIWLLGIGLSLLATRGRRRSKERRP
jgi:uncharacterized membrane protein YphA (DoxX/SURF4 family)